LSSIFFFTNNKEKKIPILFRNQIFDIPSTTYGSFGIYKYPAKFIPQVIAFVLKNLAKPGMKIFDPFAGYGTVGLVSRIYGYDYELWELNPIIEIIHKTATMSPTKVNIDHLLRRISSSNEEFVPKWTNLHYWFPDEFLPLLSKVWGFVHSLNENSKERLVLTIPLLKVTKYFSYCDEKIYKLYRSKYAKKKVEELLKLDWKKLFFEMLRKEIEHLLRKLRENESLKPRKVNFRILSGIDTLNTSLETDVDILITSPPYLQAQEYIRTTKIELFWLGYSEDYIKSLSRKEIPYRDVPEIKIFSKSYHEIREQIKEIHLKRLYDRYFHAILNIFSSLGERVREYMCIFVGPAKIRNKPIPIDDIVREHLTAIGWKHVVTFVDKIVSRAMFETKINPASGVNDSRMKTEHLVILKR